MRKIPYIWDRLWISHMVWSFCGINWSHAFSSKASNLSKNRANMRPAGSQVMLDAMGGVRPPRKLKKKELEKWRERYLLLCSRYSVNGVWLLIPVTLLVALLFVAMLCHAVLLAPVVLKTSCATHKHGELHSQRGLSASWRLLTMRNEASGIGRVGNSSCQGTERRPIHIFVVLLAQYLETEAPGSFKVTRQGTSAQNFWLQITAL